MELEEGIFEFEKDNLKVVLKKSDTAISIEVIDLKKYEIHAINLNIEEIKRLSDNFYKETEEIFDTLVKGIKNPSENLQVFFVTNLIHHYLSFETPIKKKIVEFDVKLEKQTIDEKTKQNIMISDQASKIRQLESALGALEKKYINQEKTLTEIRTNSKNMKKK